MSIIKKGQRAKLKQPVIAGDVIDRRINPDTDEMELLLDYQTEGVSAQRWFDADLLEVDGVESSGLVTTEEGQL